MAIVINGSGTVTGISVGGLPDGTVDAGTLATNSVDSAELIDGAVDDSHMAAMAASKLTGALPAISGASLTGLTSSQMPTGSVIQVTQGNSSTTYNTTSTSVVAGPVSQSMTLNNSSNKILVCFNFLGYATWGGAYNGARYAIYRGGDVSGTRLTSGSEPQLLTYSNEVWAWQSLWYLDTPGGNTNYCLGLWKHGSAANAAIQGAHGYTTMTLMEIQV